MARGPKPIGIPLAPPVRRELESLAHSTVAAHRRVQRARIILACAAGLTSVEVARRVGCSDRVVRKWRSRFARALSVDTLADAKRSGRPSRVRVETRCELIKLACSRPEEGPRAPFRDVWTHDALGQALFESAGVRLSRSEIGRILRAEDLRPHRMRLWLHSPDPEFAPKVQRICELYRAPPPGSTVLSIDEKTCIQALARRHPTVYPAPGRFGRFEFEYKRHGTLVLLAALDIRTGQLFGQCRPRRTAEDLLQFIEAVAQRYPRGEVYTIWDNLNIHCGERWRRFNERHGGRFHFVYTPKHASWVNQVEIWFAILQRRVLRYGNFTSREELRARVEGFIEHWNDKEAHPFRWTFRGRFRQHPPLRVAA